MIDHKAFRSLSSGLYLITAKAGERRCGCGEHARAGGQRAGHVVGVAQQGERHHRRHPESALPSPRCSPRTRPWSSSAPSAFHTSTLISLPRARAPSTARRCPYVTEHGLARFSVSPSPRLIDVGSHLFIRRVVEEAEVLTSGDPSPHLCLPPRREGRQDLSEGRHLQRGRPSKRRFPLPRLPPARRLIGKEDRLALHHLRLHRGRPSRQACRRATCPICGAPARSFGARGAVVRVSNRKPPTICAGGFVSGIMPRLQRAVAPVFQAFDNERMGALHFREMLLSGVILAGVQRVGDERRAVVKILERQVARHAPSAHGPGCASRSSPWLRQRPEARGACLSRVLSQRQARSYNPALSPKWLWHPRNRCRRGEACLRAERS